MNPFADYDLNRALDCADNMGGFDTDEYDVEGVTSGIVWMTAYIIDNDLCADDIDADEEWAMECFIDESATVDDAALRGAVAAALSQKISLEQREKFDAEKARQTQAHREALAATINGGE